MAAATALSIHCEYEPGPTDRLLIEADGRKWQFWFTGRHDLRQYLAEAVKYRALPKAAADEGWEVVESWWAYQSDMIDDCEHVPPPRWMVTVERALVVAFWTVTFCFWLHGVSVLLGGGE